MAHLPRPLKLLLELPDERRRLGPFHLVAPLGRGGFAPVWLAREVYGATELRAAAVKLFSLDTPDGSASSRAAVLYRARVIDEAREGAQAPGEVRLAQLRCWPIYRAPNMMNRPRIDGI